MIGENIKNARKRKGFSQEELAVKLNVVRQTVSKWENSLSVPDADVLIELAELLEVPVSQLLGVESQPDEEQDLTQRLADLNEQIAAYSRRERLAQQINKKRGAILLLSFLTLAVSITVRNEMASLVLFGACILTAIGIFYRNLALLTGTTASHNQLGAVRAVTIFNIVLIVVLLAAVAAEQTGLVAFSDNGTRVFLTVCVVVAMLFFGFIAPKLPFNRYTGFRLPWTIQDEDTWNVAHRILGYLAVPVALLYVAACWVLGQSMEQWGIVTISAFLLWIGIPGVLSLLFFWKKMRGKL